MVPLVFKLEWNPPFPHCNRVTTLILFITVIINNKAVVISFFMVYCTPRGSLMINWWAMTFEPSRERTLVLVASINRTVMLRV